MASATFLRCPDGTYLYGDEDVTAPDGLFEHMTLLETIAESDSSALARAFLGYLCYWKKKDFRGARRWIERSIANGRSEVEECFPHALAVLGELYDTGQGGPIDRKQALELYRVAANAGVRDAQMNLGHMYYSGVDGVLDCSKSKAIHWLERGLSETSEIPRIPMLDFQVGANGESFMISRGGKRNCQLLGMLILFNVYLKGKPFEGCSPILALKWLTNAAINGCFQAQLWLGVFATTGLGEYNDIRKGRIWIRKASDGGFKKAVEIECCFSKESLERAKEVILDEYKNSDIPFVPQVESKLIASAQDEVSKNDRSILLELDSLWMDIRAPIMLSVDFLKDFQSSPTARRILSAFSFAKKGEQLLLSDPFKESDSKRMLHYFSEAYLLETAIFQSILVDRKKLETVCETVFTEDPTCEDALIAQLPLYGGHPNDLEQGIAILTTATEVMETANSTETEKILKQSRVYVTLGWLQYRKRYYESSLGSFEKSMKIATDNFTALLGAAECCKKLEKWSDSRRLHLSFLSKASKCHKQYPRACYGIAEINLETLDAPGFCYYFEKGMESEGVRLPFLPEVDLPVKTRLLGFYFATRTDHLPFCSSCLQLEMNELRCVQCCSVYYCNKTCQKARWEAHKFSCQQGKKSTSRERENVRLANQKLRRIMSVVHLPELLKANSRSDTRLLLDDVMGFKESNRFGPVQEIQSRISSSSNCSTLPNLRPPIESSVPEGIEQQDVCDPLSHTKTGQTVHQTTRGAAGSKYSAYVSIDAPLEVQQQVVRDSLELAKMCIGESSSESTKVDVGASGKVAIYIGKEHSNSTRNLFPTQTQWFTGRSHVLRDLHKLLLSTPSLPSVVKNINVVALCGLGGTGKSSTAAEYCWLQVSYYTSGVYWLCADFVDGSLRELAACLEEDVCESSPERTMYALMAKISQLPSPWLVVIDNVDSIDQLSNGPLGYVLLGNWKQSSAACGAILVTTRCRPDIAVNELHLPSAANAVQLDVFCESEAIEFVLKSSHTVEKDVRPARDAAARLSKLLGYLPLALEQATSGIRFMKCELAHYVKEYKKMSSRLMKRFKARKVGVNACKERLSVLTTWELNFREIVKDPDYGKVAGLFLKLAAYFGADRIPVELINNGLCHDDSTAIDIESSLHVPIMVDLLTQLSLFREDLQHRLNIHRLVQEVQRDEMRLKVDEMVKVFKVGVRTLHRALQRHPPPDTTKVLTRNDTGSHIIWGSIAQHCLTFQENLLLERELLGARYLWFFNLEFATIINTSAIYGSAVGHQEQIKQLESFKFRLLNCLDDHQGSKSFQALTTVKVPLGTKAQAAVNRAISTTTESSFMSEPSGQYLEQKSSAAMAEDLVRDAVRSKGLCKLENEEPFFVGCSLSKISMNSCEFYKAFESAIQCMALMPHKHEGYTLLAELFSKLKFSNLSLPRSAATMAMFLSSPCCKEKWFTDAYPELKYVEVSTQIQMQDVLERQASYANHVVIVNGSYFAIDAVIITENLSFVALTKTHLSAFNRFCVTKKSSFIGIKVTVSKMPIEIPKTAAVDFVLCEITTSKKGFPGICLLGSAYLERCTVSECEGGGLGVRGEAGSAVVLSCTFRRNRATALEACHRGQLLAMNNKIIENRQGCYLCPFPGHCLIKHNDIYLNSTEGVFYLNVSGTELTPELATAMMTTVSEGDAVSRTVIDIDSNLISENGSYGISLQQPLSMDKVRIRNNLVTSNVFWGIFIDTPMVVDRFLFLVEKNQIRRNRCGGIFVRKFDSTKYSIEQNVIEKNHTPFGSFEQIPEKELSKSNIVRHNGGPEKGTDCPGSWIDSFCCRCHKEMKMIKNDKYGHFCKMCYSVRYCSEDCLLVHAEKHSMLCELFRNKYSTVVRLDSASNPPQKLFSGFKTSQKSAESSQSVMPEYSRFVVKVRSKEHDPKPGQDLMLTSSNGEHLAKFECADLFPVIIECGSIIPGTSSAKEISCWAVTEDPGRSLRVFYDELVPLKRSK